MSEDAPRRPQVNWVQSLAASLAAVTSAVLLSTVGVAGTLIGAALGSLALTIGNAVYSHYIETTKERVAAAHAAAASRVARAQARVRYASRKAGGVGATQELAQANRDLEDARDELGDAQPGEGEGDAGAWDGSDGPVGPDDQDGPGEAAAESAVRPRWRELLSGLPWKRIAILASATFVVAMLVILAFELATGRAVSSYTGGSDPDRRTSIPGLGGGGAASDTDDPSAPDGANRDSTDSGTADSEGTSEGGVDGGAGGGTGSTDTGTGGTEDRVDEPTPTSAPEEDTETTVAPETSEETPAPAPSPEPVAPETEVPPPTE